MVRLWTIGVVTVSVAVLSACERAPEQKAESSDEEPEMAIIEPRPELSPERKPAVWEPESVDFSTWPGSVDAESFDLMWLGGEESVELHAEPRREADVGGTTSWLDGEEIDWSATVVQIEEPRRYRADEAFVLEATPFDAEFGELEREVREYELDEDEVLYSYRYDGDGMCYLGIDGQIVYATCPDGRIVADAGDEVEDSEMAWHPVEARWWVEVDEGPSGWFVVDDAPVEVLAREVEGYDGVDGPQEPVDPAKWEE